MLFFSSIDKLKAGLYDTENVRPNIEITKKILLFLFYFLLIFQCTFYWLFSVCQCIYCWFNYYTFRFFLKPCQFGYNCNSIKENKKENLMYTILGRKICFAGLMILLSVFISCFMKKSKKLFFYSRLFLKEIPTFLASFFWTGVLCLFWTFFASAWGSLLTLVLPLLTILVH